MWGSMFRYFLPLMIFCQSAVALNGIEKPVLDLSLVSGEWDQVSAHGPSGEGDFHGVKLDYDKPIWEDRGLHFSLEQSIGDDTSLAKEGQEVSMTETELLYGRNFPVYYFKDAAFKASVGLGYWRHFTSGGEQLSDHGHAMTDIKQQVIYLPITVSYQKHFGHWGISTAFSYRHWVQGWFETGSFVTSSGAHIYRHRFSQPDGYGSLFALGGDYRWHDHEIGLDFVGKGWLVDYSDASKLNYRYGNRPVGTVAGHVPKSLYHLFGIQFRYRFKAF